MRVIELEQAINQLPVSDQNVLFSWMVERHHNSWDHEIAEDLAAGRLDSFLDEAEIEYNSGAHRPL